MCIGRKNNRTYFYTVYLKDCGPQNWITVTCSKKDAREYVHRVLKLEHMEHYKMWCELRDYNIDSPETWYKYFRTVLTKEDICKYLIGEISYGPNELASVIRVFVGCQPIGCSFDTKNEYDFLKYQVETQEQAQKISEKIKEEMQRLEEMQKEKESGDIN